jgi:hypothetical protein
LHLGVVFWFAGHFAPFNVLKFCFTIHLIHHPHYTIEILGIKNEPSMMVH